MPSSAKSQSYGLRVGGNQASTTRWRGPSSEHRGERDQLSVVGRITTAPFWTLIATLLIVWFLMHLVQAGSTDQALLSGMYAGDRSGFITLARTITHFGSWCVLYPVLGFPAVLFLFQKRIRAACLVFAIPVSGRWLVLFQKHEFGLMRPTKELHLVQIQGLAFPSGHTASATMAYLSSALLFTGAGQFFVVGCSRIMLGAHWPADVVGGWACGAWTLAWLRLAEINHR